MKNLSFFQRIVFFINNVFALLLLLSILIPYIPPKSFPLISVGSLTVPILLVIHLVFILYWILVGFKKQFLLSTLCILLAISFSYFPYKFSGRFEKSENTIKIMSYNVRLFNLYNWIKGKNIPIEISKFIALQTPDIVSFQEFDSDVNIPLEYNFKYVKKKGENNNFGQAIFSRFPIINKGSLEFEGTSNNIIFADLQIKQDTVRVYNIHLESFGIKGDLENLDENKSKKLIQRVSSTFVKQQPQVEQLLAHLEKCSYKTMICGDFNNTAYSWVYKQIKGDYKDSFLQAGQGFGKTFELKKFPLRIDFILVNPEFEILAHQNFNIKYSDHEPIMATIKY